MRLHSQRTALQSRVHAGAFVAALLIAGACSPRTGDAGQGAGTAEADSAPRATATARETAVETAGPATTAPTATTTAAAVPAGLDFSLPGVQGGVVDGAELAGAHVVLWFWAPW